MKRVLTLLLLATFSGGAQAQGTLQSLGTLLPGHAVMAYDSLHVLDAGGPAANGVAPLNNINPGTLPLGYAWVNSGLGSCGFSAYANTTYSTLCGGFDGSGNGVRQYTGALGAGSDGWTVNGATVASATSLGVQLFLTPTAPTPAIGDSSAKVATTAFVNSAVGAAGVASLPWEANNAALAGLTQVTSTRAIRGGINSAGDVAAQVFWGQNGTCASHSLVNDIGRCVDASDGNSWVSTLPILDASQFNIPAHGSDGTAAAQKAINAASAAGKAVYFPVSFDYTTLALPPKLVMLCGGRSQPLYRTADGQGAYTVDATTNTYPHAAVTGGLIRNCTFDGQNHIGTNLLVGNTDNMVLRDVWTVHAGNTGAEAGVSIAAGTLTVNALRAGAIATGMTIQCPGCRASNNTYPTVTSGSGSTWTVSGASDVTSVEAVFSPGWTYTDSLGSHTLPTANAIFLGGDFDDLQYTDWHGGGATGTIVGGACTPFTPIGILADTTRSNGSNKLNESGFSRLDLTCNLLGLAVQNGGDNLFAGLSFQDDVIGEFMGGGANGANQNITLEPYFEGGSSPTMQVAVIYDPNGQYNQVIGNGSMTNVVNPTMDKGGGNNWVQHGGTIRQFDDAQIIDTFWQSAAPGQYVLLSNLAPNTDSFLLDSGDGASASRSIMTHGAGVSQIMLGHESGSHLALAAVQVSNVLGRLGSYGQYDSTAGHLNFGATIEFQASETWNSTSAGSRIDFRTVPNTTKTLTDRWFIDNDGSFYASGLAGRGAGWFSANILQPQTLYNGSGGSAIPGCGANQAGSIATVSDGKASPTANTAYAAGDGAAKQPVWCSGSGWVYLM